MTLTEVLVESVKIMPAARWAQWVSDGAEHHDFSALPSIVGASEHAVYCPNCWTAFLFLCRTLVNRPVDLTIPFVGKEQAAIGVLEAEGHTLEELEELSAAQKEYQHLAELSNQAFRHAVAEKYGPEIMQRIDDAVSAKLSRRFDQAGDAREETKNCLVASVKARIGHLSARRTRNPATCPSASRGVCRPAVVATWRRGVPSLSEGKRRREWADGRAPTIGRVG
jgi:hypothetical protein